MTVDAPTQPGPLDPQVQQRLAGIRDAILAAGDSADPQQALAHLEQAQRQLQEVLDAPAELQQ